MFSRLASSRFSLAKLPDRVPAAGPPRRSAWRAGAIGLRPRDPHAVTRGFVRRARKLGFARLRLHDLRGSHVMMRAYAKALPSDDAITLDALAAIEAIPELVSNLCPSAAFVQRHKCLILLAGVEGLEPTTPGFGVRLKLFCYVSHHHRAC
jgi:hypothetical protein